MLKKEIEDWGITPHAVGGVDYFKRCQENPERGQEHALVPIPIKIISLILACSHRQVPLTAHLGEKQQEQCHIYLTWIPTTLDSFDAHSFV
jgi:hypothetical protein